MLSISKHTFCYNGGQRYKYITLRNGQYGSWINLYKQLNIKTKSQLLSSENKSTIPIALQIFKFGGRLKRFSCQPEVQIHVMSRANEWCQIRVGNKYGDFDWNVVGGIEDAMME